MSDYKWLLESWQQQCENKVYGPDGLSNNQLIGEMGVQQQWPTLLYSTAKIRITEYGSNYI